MDKTPWLLFWASVVIMFIGAVNRFMTEPIFEDIASGTYWKAAIALVAYAVALTQLRGARGGA